MGKILTILAAFALLTLPATDVRAQVTDAATSQARARLACGTGTVVGAETLANGTIRVTCRQSSRLPSALSGAALTPAAAGAVTVVFVCIVACGGSESESTTTSRGAGIAGNP